MFISKRTFLVLILSVSFVATAGAQVPGPPPPIPSDQVLNIETRLVDVPVFVTDSLGKPVTGLKRGNFEVFEDGKAQEIASFSPTDAPFEVALLLDTSGSTRSDLRLITQAARYFINSLRPGDKVSIVSFNQTIEGRHVETYSEIVSPLTNDRKSLSKALRSVGTSNGTPFYDGVLMVAEEIFGKPAEGEFKGRRALVALTDGVDSTSFWDYGRAKRKLLASGIAAYFIDIDTREAFEENLLGDCLSATQFSMSQIRRYYDLFPKNSGMEKVYDFCKIGDFTRLDMSKRLYELAGKEMNELADLSGGKVFRVADVSDAGRAFSEVAAEIGTRYTLGYYSSNEKHDGRYRKIRVKLKGLPPGTAVRAREGYTAPTN